MFSSQPGGSRRTGVLYGIAVSLAVTASASAATLCVPGDRATIQTAIDSADDGDTVLVEAGTYRERIRLRPGVIVKSAGDDSRGTLGLKRAESTVIDGSFEGASGPGVAMAEGSVLDGFTVTGVGEYDDRLWMKHHATHGEEQPHERIGAPGTAGISVVGVNRCTVANNIVHHIGYSGIAIVGEKDKRVSPRVVRNVCYRNMGAGIASMRNSTTVIEENTCFENYYAGIGTNDASPLVIGNVCHGNIRAGIGVSEHARPIVRGNKCYGNRRAGIGIRSGTETQPIVEGNECFENEMAGIGSRDDSRAIIRGNRCYRNKMAGIAARDGARALIESNECFENKMAGIGARSDSAPVIRDNRCYRNGMAGIGVRESSRAVIESNECFENEMAGIGAQQDAMPIILDNQCYKNEMAGIGARLGARPVIVRNDCFENRMAGIGARDGAAPILCENRCSRNRRAGIGSRGGARSVIVDNESRENLAAGIGVRDSETVAVIVGNRCIENRLVAIGLPNGATAYIHGNELLRTGGGAPPLAVVKGGSTAVVSHNSISGGGVAAVLAQGDVSVIGNRFRGRGPGQNTAVWVWNDSTVTVSNNRVTGYRNAINASGSRVTATDNVTRAFHGPSIIVKKPSSPVHIFDNTAISGNSGDSAVDIEGATRTADGNMLETPESVDESSLRAPPTWPLVSGKIDGESFHPLRGSGRQLIVQDGPWQLVATYGETTTYALFHTIDDPGKTTDLSDRLEQMTFRLRGRLERRLARESSED